MLELEQLSFEYNDINSFEFNLAIGNSDSLAIMGPSGSGKTTLLNLIAGFIKPTKGKIIFKKKKITALEPSDRPISMLFQENNLFPHLNIFDNIAVGINPSLNLKKAQKEIVELTLEKMNLQGFARRYPHQLSGGQKQRVAIARIIIRNKPILLLDEPFTSLDYPLRIEILQLIKSLQQEHSLALIMVTHDFKEAKMLCNKSCFLQDGKILHFNNTEKFIETAKDPIIKSYIS